jgi:two-component system, NtrC family, sensor kinase
LKLLGYYIDVNGLADEYLRPTHRGLRAKDKSFNAAIQKDPDKSLSAGHAGIGRGNTFPQDKGSVLLNLFTNAAFYAVMKRRNKKTNGVGIRKRY